jgi:hypothetical protein
MVLLQRLIETAIPRLPQPPVATLTGHDIFDLTKNGSNEVPSSTASIVTAAPRAADQSTNALVPLSESSDTKRRRILDAIESRLPAFRQRLPKNATSSTVHGADEIMDQFESMTLEERAALLKKFSSNRYLVSKVPKQKFNLCKSVPIPCNDGTNKPKSQPRARATSHNSSAKERLASAINLHEIPKGNYCKL